MGFKEKTLSEVDYRLSQAIKHRWVSAGIVLVIFFISTAVFSLSEAGCILVLIALATSIARQNVSRMKKGFIDLEERVNDLMKNEVERLENQTPEQVSKRKFGKYWEERNSEDFKRVQDSLDTEQSALWLWEIAIGTTGTFFWGFGDRITTMFS